MIEILRADKEGRERLLRAPEALPDVSGAVRDIIADVRARGDEALYAYTRRFDRAELQSLRVSGQEFAAARAAVDLALYDVMAKAAQHIRTFHEQQMRQGFLLMPRPGVTCGQRLLPITQVGLYVPGGTAAYPSSVLMNAIPAQIAGCRRICMVSPPRPDGSIAPAILVAAEIAGLDEVYKLGGAQAIAALAYGTESVPRVDKILGPGNAYVAEAKRQVFGQVAIDMVAGPSEILIIADESGHPDWLAADLLSQAEHDVLASAVLLTPSEPLAKAVTEELERQLADLPRADIARQSLEHRGRIVLVQDLDEAFELSNALAPEHLELALDEPWDWLPSVENAGSVFLGHHCPEAMGDYYIGCNHTLPTAGTARFSSPLSVDDYMKKIQFSFLSRGALGREGGEAALFARAEGLEAHARSLDIRFEGETP